MKTRDGTDPTPTIGIGPISAKKKQTGLDMEGQVLGRLLTKVIH